MTAVNLINDLAQITRQLLEFGVIEQQRDDLSRQIAELKRECENLHTKHAELHQQVRYEIEAVEALRKDTAKARAQYTQAAAELKKLLSAA